MSEPLKLNLGAGGTELPGYVNIDRKTGGEVYPLSDKFQPHFPNEFADEIRASHVLEHFGHEQTVAVLQEWVRVLKPGGVLKVAVPDFDKIVHFYQNGLDPKVEGYLMGGHVDDDDRHGAIFNDGKLRELMKLAGLSGIRRWTSEIGDCASLPVSLNLMGTKRAPVEKLDGVSGIMSMPRLCFTDQATACYEACHKLRIPMRVRQGVYWEATLTRAIEMTLEGDATEFILTIDYDTVFTPEDVKDLYALMRDNPTADAICAAQVGRDRDSLLLTIRGEDGNNSDRVEASKVFETELLPISTGHFGLTLIRVSSLLKLPKPWFCSKPAPDGTWGDGRVDADIAFWRAAEAAGWNVYQANTVSVGHLQLMASWPGRDFRPIHQYVNQYREDGKPQGVLS